MNTQHKLDIRSMITDDLEEVLEIQNETGLSFWSETDYKSEIENKDSLTLVATIDKQVTGFAVVRLLLGEDGINFTSAEIYNIAVKNSFQKKGIGQLLFDKILLTLKSKRVLKLFLEVRASNLKAINFYEKNGFVKEFVRKGYYQDPLEEAYILKLWV